MSVTVIQAESLSGLADGLAATDRTPRINGHEPLEAAGDEDGHPHPLAVFVDLDGKPRPPSWIIPGFIAAGVVVFAGAHGAGKTTAIVPLSLVAAGLHARGDPLAPKHWRHVVYVAEDPEQVRRVLAGMCQCAVLRIDPYQLRERIHLVEAKRLPPEEVAEVGKVYRKRFTRSVGGVELLPLVVLDTKAAVLEIEDENSNAETSRTVATLKQGFVNLPTWIVGHVAKADVGRSDVAALSSRGAGALDADAHQTLFLVKDGDGSRYLVEGKTRFEPAWPELQIEPHTAEIQAIDEFGEPESLMLRWSTPKPPTMTRTEAREAAQDGAREAAMTELRTQVLDLVDTAWRNGNPLNREGVKAKIQRKRAEVVNCIESLTAERWLIEVPVPAKLRTHPRRSEFLARLSPAEHDAVNGGAPVPAEKMEIPPSWRRSIPSVPHSAAAAGTDGPLQGGAGRA